MADGNILSDFGINILEEEIDDVIFQTNEFLTDATFTGSQGPFWWLAHFCLFLRCQYSVNQYFTFFLLRETNPKRDKNGTEPQENKIKNALLRISVSEYLLYRYKGTNLSREKQIETSKYLCYNTLFIFLYQSG